MPEPLAWQIATVAAIRAEAPGVNSFTLDLPSWRAHRAGQHYDVRLTAPDGYQAQRSYSVASPPSCLVGLWGPSPKVDRFATIPLNTRPHAQDL